MTELSVEVKLQGLFLTNPTSALKIFDEEMRKGFEESTSLMMREVDKRTPRGVTAHLADSLFREVKASGLELYGVIATPLAYAKRVETGEVYTPEYASLLEWVRLKLGLAGSHLYAVTRVIRHNITLRGQKVARFMFDKGFQAGQPKALKILERDRKSVV